MEKKEVDAITTLTSFNTVHFPKMSQVLKTFTTKEFVQLPSRKRYGLINRTLLQLIQEMPDHSFLLPAAVEFIDQINKENFLGFRYHIILFESWLNQFSELSDEENYKVRAKLVGKFIPREEYQVFFPIGMNKTLLGTHFVAAHLSPDVDTMVASFWGWVDAFGARVGSASHIWSLPGGPPDSPVTEIFKQLFSQGVFFNLSSSSGTLTLSAMDLMTQRGLIKTKGTVSSISNLDLGFGEKAIVLVDEEGHLLGDWHNVDIEPIRKIIIRFKSCLRWFENNLRGKLISLFAKKDLNKKDLIPFFASIFDMQISECEPAKEFTERQKKDLQDFFTKVIGLKNGLNGNFRELNDALSALSVYDLLRFQQELEGLKDSNLFDAAGNIIENRPALFIHIEKITHQLDDAIQRVRDYVEQLDVALLIKSQVFGINMEFVTPHSDVEEIRIKMHQKDYLLVVVPEDNGKLFPLGVVWASSLRTPTLGTVSFRDFCNQEEVRMASYLVPISVVDHHKTSLKTDAPPMALIGDTQSSNVIIAEQSLQINDKYSTNGSTAEAIDKELQTLTACTTLTPSQLRILYRLLKRKMASENRKNYFVHPQRELAEYFCFLHAILDDTDLLSKVSMRDVDCVAKLLNRIKSLTEQREMEVINLQDIPYDKNFLKVAAKRLLQSQELYAIYNEVFATKEQELEKSLQDEQEEILETLFVDTKEQNGCCRVGQTKLFTSNFPSFQKSRGKLMHYWLNKAEAQQTQHPKIDLHMHMISTIASAEEVFKDQANHYQHEDQLWFWVPNTQKAHDHLASFLTAFMASQKKLGTVLQLEFCEKVSEEVKRIFMHNCHGIKIGHNPQYKLPITILYVKAGSLNSRKAMITPFLPRLV